MVARVMTMLAGLAGGASLSQFPEYSQQYMQRLGGAVDELSRQVNRYEGDAAEAGLSLTAYIEALAAEGELSKTQAANIEDDITRHDRLSGMLGDLQSVGPFSRARLAVSHLSDAEIAKAALDDFKPALPATFEGASFAGAGFLGGWLGLGLVFALLGALWRSLVGLLRPRRRV